MGRGREVLRIGRYELAGQLASGGMASVHLGRIRGAQGFSRVVVIKRILPELATKPDFVRMFVNEAQLAARVRHPNVVATLDAVEHEAELLLVMEFVHGLSLAKLVSLAAGRNGRIPLRISAAIMAGSLRGIHAAHEAKDELGRPLTIVHRDVSPQNILLGRDGLARVLDFGVAKAVDQTRSLTMFGEFKGKMTYAAPEQVLSQKVSRSTDIYAAGLVLWELATGLRRYGMASHGAIIKSLTDERVPMPSTVDRTLPRAIDRIIHYATQREPAFRYRTAEDMAREIEEHVGVAPAPEVSAWLTQVAAPELARLDELIASVETSRDARSDRSVLSATQLAVAETEVATSPSGAPTTSSKSPSSPPWKVRRSPLLPVFGAVVGAALVLGGAGLYAARRDAAAATGPGSEAARHAGETLSPAQFASLESKGATSPSSSAAGEGAAPPRRMAPLPSAARSAGAGAGAPAAAPPAVDCAPPYYFDPSGIKHVKAGCG